MVMIVIDTVLVASRGTNRLNPPKKVIVDQYRESVVHSLARNAADIGLGHHGDFVRGHVRSARNRSQHGKSLGRDLYPVFAELVEGGDSHSKPTVAAILDLVQNRRSPNQDQVGYEIPSNSLMNRYVRKILASRYQNDAMMTSC